MGGLFGAEWVTLYTFRSIHSSSTEMQNSIKITLSLEDMVYFTNKITSTAIIHLLSLTKNPKSFELC
jgi:hypothetical protein